MFRASICPSSGVLGCIPITLLHMVFSTRCCGWGSEEPVFSLVHWCKFCIKWASLVSFIYDARTHIHQRKLDVSIRVEFLHAIIQYKLTKCNFSKSIFQFLIFWCVYMFRTLGFIFRKTVVYSGMVLYILSIEHTLLPTRLLILMHVKHTILYLYQQPSSWRWTLGFETCRRHQKIKN